MNGCIVGFDFSMNSCSVCIADSNNGNYNYYYLVFIRENLINNKNRDLINKLCSLKNVEVFVNKKLEISTKNLSDRSSIYLNDMYLMNEKIADRVKDKLIEISKLSIRNLYIVFEGFSFGSSTNTLTQISGYTYLLKYILIKELEVDANDIYTFSPISIKSKIGINKKDYGDKSVIINKFINEYDGNDDFINYLKNNKDSLKTVSKKTGKETYFKPIDDMVDSYFIANYFAKNILKNQ